MTESETRHVLLAAIDGSPLGDGTAAVAVKRATARGEELHFVTVIPWVPASATAAERAAGLDASSLLEAARVMLDGVAKRAGFDGQITCHIALGDPAREILQMAARIAADEIVIGCTGKHGLQRVLLGSVAERVVRHASCPVVVVRDKDYDATLAPEIEPPCPDCLETQRATKGAKMWCERHSAHRVKGTTHYEYPQTFAVGSMLIR